MDMIFTDNDISSQLDAEMKLLESSEGALVIEPSQMTDRVKFLANNGGEQFGESMPWAKADGVMKIRQGELSIWAGINGHGKSQLLGQVMLWLMKTHKILVASLEMRPEQTLYRMINQYAGCIAGAGFCEKALNKFDGRLWIYDQLDTVEPERILALIHYAARELGIDHIVIDSLTKCGISYDDYKAEKEFIDRLQWAAKNLNIHIHLVCHIRKGKSEHEPIDKFSIRGSGAISDIADNVFIVKRNKIKEAIMRTQKSGQPVNDKDLKKLEEPDCFLKIDKNRHGGEEGELGLWFHKSSGQYIPSDANRPMTTPF